MSRSTANSNLVKIKNGQNSEIYKQRRKENLEGVSINFDDPFKKFTLKQAYRIAKRPLEFQEVLFDVCSPEFLIPYNLKVCNICGLSIRPYFNFEIPDEEFYEHMINTPKVVISRINATNTNYGDKTIVYKLIMLAPDAKNIKTDAGNPLNVPRLYSLTITTDKEEQKRFRILFQAIIGGYEDGLLSLYNIENTHFDAYQSAYTHRDLDIKDGDLHDHEIDIESGNNDIQDSEFTEVVDIRGGNNFENVLQYVLNKYNCGYNYIPAKFDTTIEEINDVMLVRNKFFGVRDRIIERIDAPMIVKEIKELAQNAEQEDFRVRFEYLYKDSKDDV